MWEHSNQPPRLGRSHRSLSHSPSSLCRPSCFMTASLPRPSSALIWNHQTGGVQRWTVGCGLTLCIIKYVLTQVEKGFTLRQAKLKPHAVNLKSGAKILVSAGNRPVGTGSCCATDNVIAVYAAQCRRAHGKSHCRRQISRCEAIQCDTAPCSVQPQKMAVHTPRTARQPDTGPFLTECGIRTCQYW